MPDGEGTYGNQVGRPSQPKKETNPVDSFMNTATDETDSNIISNNGLSQSEVTEIQAGLNFLQAAGLNPDAKEFEKLKLDGSFGPKTYAMFKTFFKQLPEGTQKAIKPTDNPLADF
tara:strand:- start:1119 stop:1466 length:348 start_codon:yes stop_codon:yes gene_type:complete